MKWTRKTKEFEYAPYIREDEAFRVQDLNDNPIGEYAKKKSHNWDSKESHEEFLKYCKENNIRLSGPNWVIVNNRTNEVIGKIFKSAKEAKEFANRL